MSDEHDPMDPGSWRRAPGVCGSCIAWKPGDPRPGEEVAAGECRLRPELHRVPATLKKCSLYKGRGTYVYAPTPESGTTRRKRVSAPRVLRRTQEGKLVETKRQVEASGPPPATVEPRGPIARPAGPRTLEIGTDDPSTLRHAFRDVLRREFPDSGREMLGRYEGGKVEVHSADGLVKKIDVERFFAMLENFRVTLDLLEDRIVQTDALLPHVPELTGQLRRVQGTFTTFNILYEDRADYFSGKV